MDVEGGSKLRRYGLGPSCGSAASEGTHCYASAAMKPISDAHARLGRALRQVRESAGITTRQIPKADLRQPFFSSAHISLVERGCAVPSQELIDAYVGIAGRYRQELLTLLAQATAASRLAANARRRGIAANAADPPPREV